MLRSFSSYSYFSSYFSFTSKTPKIIRIPHNRTFSSDNDIIHAIKSRPTIVRSRYEKNASVIIKEVKNGNYNAVRILAKKSNINGYNFWENTPLTDAAKRGDVKAIKFLIEELGANVHASCDCPDNKTALHYAVENGNSEAVEALISLGASPALKDAQGYTAFDVVPDQNDKIIQILNRESKLYLCSGKNKK